MSHGRPDWYNIAPLIQIHASEDINELAARLGAHNTVDRRGNVIACERFAGGLDNLYFDSDDMGSNADWYSQAGLYDSLCMRLNTIAGAAHWTSASRTFPLPAAGSLAVEFGWSNEVQPTAMQWRIEVFDGVNNMVFEVKYTFDSGVMAWWDGSVWTTLYTDTNVWLSSLTITNYLKLAVDLDAALYLRLITGDRSDSMAGLTPDSVAADAVRLVAATITVYAHDTIVTRLYLQWVTLTINER